jgi:hypothetical protein
MHKTEDHGGLVVQHLDRLIDDPDPDQAELSAPETPRMLIQLIVRMM